MNYLLHISLILLSAILAFQDIKTRQISLYVLLLWLGVALAIVFQKYPVKEVGFNTLVNGSFVLIVFLILTAYFSAKEKQIVNIIDKYIGLGDLAFFLLLGVCFSPANYLLFFTCGLFLTLVGSVLLQLFYRNTAPEIPLAGAFAVQFIFLLSLRYFIRDFDPYSDSWMYKIFFN